MTLNQVITRIKTIALAHKQVRNFQAGLVTDFLTDHTTKYPSVFLEDNGGVISTNGQASTLSYRMYFVDLVNVSEATKQNEQDVQSDMFSVAEDVVAQMNAGDYNDWALSTDNNVQLVVEENGDMYAGVIVDFSIRIQFKQNRCQIPSDLLISVTDNDTKMYDVEYFATGTENLTLDSTAAGSSLNVITGKKVLLVTRESAPLYKVSSNPDSAEFTWNDTLLGLGTKTNVGERFLILYRNY